MKRAFNMKKQDIELFPIEQIFEMNKRICEI